jgi:hypothetical protein
MVLWLFIQFRHDMNEYANSIWSLHQKSSDDDVQVQERTFYQAYAIQNRPTHDHDRIQSPQYPNEKIEAIHTILPTGTRMNPNNKMNEYNNNISIFTTNQTKPVLTWMVHRSDYCKYRCITNEIIFTLFV